MAAGSGGKIAAARQQPQCAQIDLLIAALGIIRRFSRLGEGRRIENDEVIGLSALRLQLRQKLKHVRDQKVHAVVQSVAPGVELRQFDRTFGNIHRRHVRRAALRRIERKGAGMREAIEHTLVSGKLCHRQAVILLVKEEARFLSVFHIDAVINAVFADLRHRVCRRGQTGQRIPALILRKPLLPAEGNIVPLKNAGDLLAVLAQHFHQQREHDVLAALHAE